MQASVTPPPPSSLLPGLGQIACVVDDEDTGEPYMAWSECLGPFSSWNLFLIACGNQAIFQLEGDRMADTGRGDRPVIDQTTAQIREGLRNGDVVFRSSESKLVVGRMSRQPTEIAMHAVPAAQSGELSRRLLVQVLGRVAASECGDTDNNERRAAAHQGCSRQGSSEIDALRRENERLERELARERTMNGSYSAASMTSLRSQATSKRRPVRPPAASLVNPRTKMTKARGTEFGSDSEADG
ncbi:uncharacterized protein BJ171DRAFT_520350 [Polychytrium aggregatum]|uniref:uncharacterized protein n=1 Tax=Polychytrium aggregatum TaxID=110093 RepID=UPI0022FF1F7E|nr:uncharacterized protein BJ171DRAFT_520350 [Polychytrium aggregatum]KAI9197242.1 hypothetical protein BJ171DRAFT_520350 [Polychytrium aggregatum]